MELIGSTLDSAISDGVAVSSGVLLARELVNAPANFTTPALLAETAVKIAGDYGMEVEILEQEDCEKLGCVKQNIETKWVCSLSLCFLLSVIIWRRRWSG